MAGLHSYDSIITGFASFRPTLLFGEHLAEAGQLQPPLQSKLAEATEKYAIGEITVANFEFISSRIGKGLTMLTQGMRIVLSASAAKQKLNSGK
jgi:hypothetical protein